MLFWVAALSLLVLTAAQMGSPRAAGEPVPLGPAFEIAPAGQGPDVAGGATAR